MLYSRSLDARSPARRVAFAFYRLVVTLRCAAREPIGVRRVHGEVSVVVVSAVCPPGRAAFTERHLCAMYPGTRVLERFCVTRFATRAHRAPRLHELFGQGLALRNGERGVGAAPQSPTHDEVATVGSHRMLRRFHTHDLPPSAATRPRSASLTWWPSRVMGVAATHFTALFAIRSHPNVGSPRVPWARRGHDRLLELLGHQLRAAEEHHRLAQATLSGATAPPRVRRTALQENSHDLLSLTPLGSPVFFEWLQLV